MSLEKQLLINSIGFPFDISNNIKSFVFYDIISFETILFIKQKKRQIQEFLENDNIIFYSYNNLYNNPAMVCKWYITYGYIQSILTNHTNGLPIILTIEACICLSCGNYIKSNNNILPRNIRCKCVRYPF